MGVDRADRTSLQASLLTARACWSRLEGSPELEEERAMAAYSIGRILNLIEGRCSGEVRSWYDRAVEYGAGDSARIEVYRLARDHCRGGPR